MKTEEAPVPSPVVISSSEEPSSPSPPAEGSRGKKRKKESKWVGGGEGFAGFIFLCNEMSKPECFRHGVFGLRKKKGRKRAYMVKKVRPSTVLFLFDENLRVLHGTFRATSDGGLDLEPQFCGGKFPAQVKFMIEKDYPPLPESVFKHAIEENYKSKRKFKQMLNSQQVNKLLSMFDPTIVLPQPIPSQITEDPRYARERVFHTTESYVTATHWIRAPPAIDPRGLPPYAPPPPNNPYNPAAHIDPYFQREHMRTYYPGNQIPFERGLPPCALPPPNNPCNPAAHIDPYFQREHMRTYYPGNQIPFERVGPQMNPWDQLPCPSQVPQHYCTMPSYQDPSRAYVYNSQRPASNEANVPDIHGRLMRGCGAPVPTDN